MEYFMNTIEKGKNIKNLELLKIQNKIIIIKKRIKNDLKKLKILKRDLKYFKK